jgi:hypothetical protein
VQEELPKEVAVGVLVEPRNYNVRIPTWLADAAQHNHHDGATCGTGPPDMVVALNAGLYAYESWRSVVMYLYQHADIVGVFTEYNKDSGINCAALGGETSCNSLSINPFHQPQAAMSSVYSMNLPQFSTNGFIYVFNAQELE